MQPTLCSRCKKNIATVFITRMEGDKTVNEGLCLKCAKSLGLPQVNEMMQRMGITDEDLDNLNNEMMQAMDSIENVEDLPGGEDDEEAGKTATFPFLNRLFNNGGEPAPKEETPAEDDDEEAGAYVKIRNDIDDLLDTVGMNYYIRGIRMGAKLYTLLSGGKDTTEEM